LSALVGVNRVTVLFDDVKMSGSLY
jgi:hypothetical protein